MLINYFYLMLMLILFLEQYILSSSSPLCRSALIKIKDSTMDLKRLCVAESELAIRKDRQYKMPRVLALIASNKVSTHTKMT